MKAPNPLSPEKALSTERKPRPAPGTLGHLDTVCRDKVASSVRLKDKFQSGAYGSEGQDTSQVRERNRPLCVRRDLADPLHKVGDQARNLLELPSLLHG